MNKDKIRIGLIGAGNIAQNAHIPSYLKQMDAELTAVCDLKFDRAKEVAQKYNMKHAVKDYQELAALSDVDAVSICTWNNAHAGAVIAAAKAGKHILCEKPMAMTTEEAYAMKAAVKESGVTFMMGFVNRFRSDSQVVKALQESGKLGEVYYAKTGWLRRRGTPLGWFTDLSKAGGGPVIDIGVHVIDLTWYLMGKPKPISVSAAAYHKIGDYKTKGVDRWVAFDTDDLVFDTEDSASGFIRFENGVALSFDVSWAINSKDTGVYSHLYGTKAGTSLEPLMLYGEEAHYLTDAALSADRQNPFDSQIRHFLDCVREGRTPISPVEDGVQIQKILNGIYDSAQQGKEILL